MSARLSLAILQVVLQAVFLGYCSGGSPFIDPIEARKHNSTIIHRKRGAPFGAIGTSDFYNLVVEDGVFVDKSMLIDEFLLRLEKVIVLSFPPRFGKTLNVDMLCRFLEVETDERGVALPAEKRTNAGLFFGGRVNYTADGSYRHLKPLEVVEWDYSATQQGAYPVVRLSLAGTRADNYAEFLDEFRVRVGRLYGKYAYVKANLTADDDKAQFEAFLTERKTDEDRMEKCLLFLSVKLEEHFGTKVYIFLDDYDAPFTNLMSPSSTSLGTAMVDEQTATDVGRTAKFIRRVLRNALRFNPAYHRAMLTGLFPTDATNLICSELENVREFTVRNASPFSAYYGFTKDDVNDLMTRLSLWDADDDVQRWYGGYQFDDSAIARKMYNPYSIMRTFRANGTCDSYWTPSMRTKGTDNENVVRYVETVVRENSSRAGFRKLLAGQSVREKLNMKDKGNFTEFLSNPYRCLLYAGYLKWLPPTEVSSPPNNKGDTVELKIPNYEIELALTNMAPSSE